MFQPYEEFTPTHYQPTFKNPTPSESNEFCLFSFPKSEKKILESFCASSVLGKIIPDPDRVWSNFTNLQVFHPGEPLSLDHVQKLMDENRESVPDKEIRSPLVGKGGL